MVERIKLPPRRYLNNWLAVACVVLGIIAFSVKEGNFTALFAAGVLASMMIVIGILLDIRDFK